MSQFSVAIMCRDDEVGQRLLHGLELLGVEAVPCQPGAAVTTSVVATDDPDLRIETRQVRILVRQVGDTQGTCPRTLALNWPLRYNQLVAALARVPALLEPSSGTRAVAGQFAELVGDSEALRRVKELVTQVARSDATVLITGESGTGKEVVARAIHRASQRLGQPFVPVNCGAIPADLLESELFGHEKGAFTGALEARPGRFELAHGGTLFLDEIGDMPLPMQVKLLRAIQEKCVERIGSARSIPCDVRIIAATHQNLDALIEQGRFREDLFYRLAVFPVVVPPLRERVEDIQPIALDKLARLEADTGTAATLTEAAWQALCAYPWPGNVRELCNLMERIAVQYRGRVVDARDLPLRQRGDSAAEALPAAAAHADTGTADADPAVVLPVNGIDLRAFLADMERSLIKQALDDTESVVARAADRLHIRRTTLVEKMRKYGIRREAV